MPDKQNNESYERCSITMRPFVWRKVDDLAASHNRSRSNMVETLLIEQMRLGYMHTPPGRRGGK